MASDNVDVSALLQQLEELKQKKARNIKKLKRKLGRAVVLKQACTDDESSRSDSNDNDKCLSYHKVNASKNRKVFGEINREEQFSNSAQTKYYNKDDALCIEKNKTDLPTVSDCSKQSSTKLECARDCSELDQKIFQSANHVINHPSNKKCPSEDSEHNQLVSHKISVTEFQNEDEIIDHSDCQQNFRLESLQKRCLAELQNDQSLGRKRSSTEFLNDDQTINHFKSNKRTKTTNCDFSESSKQQITNLETDASTVTEINKLNSPASVDCDKINPVDYNFCLPTFQSNKTEVTHLLPSLNSENSPLNDETKLENLKNDSHSNNNVEKSEPSTVLEDANFNQNLLVEKSISTESSVNKTEDRKTIIEDLSACSDLHVQCDDNVLEVANTETISHKFKEPIIPLSDPLTRTDDAIKEQEEKNIIGDELIASGTLNEIAETEELVCRDIPIDVAGFAEVATDVPTPAFLDRYLSNRVRRPIIGDELIANGSLNEIAETEEPVCRDIPIDVAGFVEVTTDVLTPAFLDRYLSNRVRRPIIGDELIANGPLNEIAETEEPVCRDIPIDVAGFVEVATDVPTPAFLDRYLSNRVRRPSLNCTFTDEEDATPDFENRIDVDKLLVKESEPDENDVDRRLVEESEPDGNDVNRHLVEESEPDENNVNRRLVEESEPDENNVNRRLVEESEPDENNVNQCLVEESELDEIDAEVLNHFQPAAPSANDIAIESEVLMIPETELFDFASYSNNECDGIAQNVCIETDYDKNCDEKIVDDCHNVCIGADYDENCDEMIVNDCHNVCIENGSNINSSKEPVFFIGNVEDVCIETNVAIGFSKEPASSFTKDNDKNAFAEHDGSAIDCDKDLNINNSAVNQVPPDGCTDTKSVSNCNKGSEVEDTTVNYCDSTQSLEVAKDCERFYSQNEFETDSFGTEDFLKLVDLQQIPFSSDSSKSNEQSDKISDSLESSLKFQCCFQSDISEEVIQLKLCYFNNSQYLFILHHTWIQVWRQETDCDWMKIFAHQVDDLQLKELCLSQNESYLVSIILLSSKESQQCLQFLVFERESRLIKLMEHIHWFENSESEDVFLCGLDDLKFASAQGEGDAFKVYCHSFSYLNENPRLLTVTLGSTADCLHSLCKIDKLPNALLGVSKNMLYVWHLLEARLVTSVHLLSEDSVSIENCVWTTIENGLIFLMATHRIEEKANACQLLAANLATGFCEVVLTYTLQPAKEVSSFSNRKMKLFYSEPFLAATSDDGAFIWSIEDEYCNASLISSDYSSIAIAPTKDNYFLVFVGCSGGCVNCYEIKYSAC